MFNQKQKKRLSKTKKIVSKEIPTEIHLPEHRERVVERGSYKCTNAESSLRINKVLEMILSGHTNGQIKHFCALNYKIEVRHSETIIAKATQRIKEINDKDNEKTLSIVLMNYWKLYRKATGDGDISLCIQILEKISKLKGLDQITVNHVFFGDSKEASEISEEIIDAEFEDAESE